MATAYEVKILFNPSGEKEEVFKNRYYFENPLTKEEIDKYRKVFMLQYHFLKGGNLDYLLLDIFEKTENIEEKLYELYGDMFGEGYEIYFKRLKSDYIASIFNFKK